MKFEFSLENDIGQEKNGSAFKHHVRNMTDIGQDLLSILEVFLKKLMILNRVGNIKDDLNLTIFVLGQIWIWIGLLYGENLRK